jgi:hypothetical protein
MALQLREPALLMLAEQAVAVVWQPHAAGRASSLRQDDAVQITGTSAGTGTRAAVVAVASFLLGAVTLFAQGFLPDALASFANSASGWTLMTVLLLTCMPVRPAVAAVLGATSFVLLTLGYAAAAPLRDLFYDPTLFALVGAAVGPFVGVATAWLWAVSPWQAALGTALLAGIGIGEAVHGLTAVADTTSPVYWVLIGAAALALLIGMLIRRILGVLWKLLALTGTCMTAGAFVLAYNTLGGV